MRVQRGFTLIELMIVIAIVGLLAGVAVPQYNRYVRKAYYVEVVSAASVIKVKIEECYALNGGAGSDAACHTSADQISVRGQVTNSDLRRAANANGVTSVSVSGGTSPVITVTPNALNGIAAADLYVLTGTLSSDSSTIVGWQPSGQGCTEGYC